MLATKVAGDKNDDSLFSLYLNCCTGEWTEAKSRLLLVIITAVAAASNLTAKETIMII